ncbi:hypothetical protein [Candidatus Similichlamydia laticola]|nr:hypothetical protein [Candidatus Similichlamydia laticola]
MPRADSYRIPVISNRHFAFQRGKKRHDRAMLVLLGLTELYLKDGQPIGSNRLKELLFPEMSASTLRNYCADLESLGFLKQQHASGGRFPTNQGLSVYAKEILQNLGTSFSLDLFPLEEQKLIQGFQKALEGELTAELNQESLWGIVPWIERAMHEMVKITGCAIALSIPRFDQDFITDIRLVQIDARRLSVIVITYFGFIRHEMIVLEEALPENWVAIESYLRSKIHSLQSESVLKPEWEHLAKFLYEEISVRFLLSKSRCSKGTILHFGLSQLICKADFCETNTLASAFNLFEEGGKLRDILTYAQARSSISLWIGEQLTELCPKTTGCALVTIPYKLGQVQVGAVALLGPVLLRYRLAFGLLMTFKAAMEHVLLRYVYRYNLDLKPYPISHNRLGHLP